jgi:hypothetical protein
VWCPPQADQASTVLTVSIPKKGKTVKTVSDSMIAPGTAINRGVNQINQHQG